jgi:hypothetical protein
VPDKGHSKKNILEVLIMELITKICEKNSVAAIRCEKIVEAILSDIKGEPEWYTIKRVCKTYSMYYDADGSLDVTVYCKSKGGRLYVIARRDNKRGKASSLSIKIKDDGRHFTTLYVWDI